MPDDDDRSDDDDARENVGIRGADADDENPIRAREPSRERDPVMRARPFWAWAVSACSALSATVGSYRQ